MHQLGVGGGDGVCVFEGGVGGVNRKREPPQRKQATTLMNKAVLIAFCDTMLYYGLVPFIKQ